MTRRRPKFVRLPTAWIESGGLKAFRWESGGSDETAALMALMVIAHHIEPESGLAHVTYPVIRRSSGRISNAKIAGGLGILEARRLVERRSAGQSSFQLTGYDPASGWAILPCEKLYNGDAIEAFESIRLRSPVELDAMKLYFAIIARRDRRRNLSFITYDQIYTYAGIRPDGIRAAISFLITNGLIQTEKVESNKDPQRMAQAYRPRYIDSYRHSGTTGRGDENYFRPPDTADVPL